VYRQVLEYLVGQLVLRALALEDRDQVIVRVRAYPTEIREARVRCPLLFAWRFPDALLLGVALRHQEEVLLGLRLVATLPRHYALHGLDQHAVLAGRLQHTRRVPGFHADDECKHDDFDL